MKLPQPGDLLDGKYQLGEPIGSGGFATVYRGVDISVGRAVAVKVLNPETDGYTSNRAARFTREARTLAGLTDPHTLRLFDFGQTEGGALFIVSELLDGADLHDILEQRGPLPEDVVVHITRQVLSALREAHAIGLLHRDIKPHNIRVFEYGGDPWYAKLMDFGVARSTAPDSPSLTQTGGVVGTPRYMPPEQLVGATLSPSSDLFSLGMVVFEMLAGSTGRLRADLAARKHIDVPCSPAFAAFVRRLLGFRAADRYTDAREALAALDVLTSGGVPVPPLEVTVPQPIRPVGDMTVPALVRPVKPTYEESATLERSRTKKAPGMAWAVVGLLSFLAVSAVVAVLVSTRTSAPEAPAGRPAIHTELLTSRAESPPIPASGTPNGAAQAVTAEVDAGAPAPGGCGRTDVTPGSDVTNRIYDGMDKTRYVTYVPKGYAPAEAHGVVMLLHTDGTSPETELDYTRIRTLADERNLIVVAPEDPEFLVWRGIGVPDRLRAVFEQVKRDYCVDDSRVFAVGNGTGSMGVEWLTCEPWVTATVSTSYRSRAAVFICPGPRPTPHLDIAPLESSHLPVEGGKGCAGFERVISLAEQEAMWRERNQCKGKPTVTETSDGSQCFAWRCEQPFMSCHAKGGHRWSGVRTRRKVDVFKCDGPPTDFPHLTVIGEFFDSVAPAG